MSNDTQVQKTSPAIKQIIAATVGADWPGKKVVVREVSPAWQHTEYIDDKTLAWYLNLSTLAETGQVRGVWRPEAVRYGGPAVIHPAPQPHEALIHVWRSQGKQGMEIIVREDAIDHQAVAVATDALLGGGKPKERGAAAAAAAKLCGNTGGLCLAIAEAHAKAFKKGETFEDLHEAAHVMAFSPRGKRKKKSAAQLEREINAALAHRQR